MRLGVVVKAREIGGSAIVEGYVCLWVFKL
jgi:hypothetical protein